jgi:hypothetical protein
MVIRVFVGRLLTTAPCYASVKSYSFLLIDFSLSFRGFPIRYNPDSLFSIGIDDNKDSAQEIYTHRYKTLFPSTSGSLNVNAIVFKHTSGIYKVNPMLFKIGLSLVRIPLIFTYKLYVHSVHYSIAVLLI